MENILERGEFVQEKRLQKRKIRKLGGRGEGKEEGSNR
jgi:hypothetical protein